MSKLINYQYLIQEVDISSNVPEKELDTPIKRSQEMLSMVIGEALYNELDTQNPNFSAPNVTLMAYVKKFLAWQAYQFWLPKANLKSHNTGIRVHREDNSDAASHQDMAELIRDAKMWCQTQKEKVVSFLERNHESYPLYDYNCGSNKRAGTGFHITAVGGKHKHGCGCDQCNGRL